jgi:hypothetical protein
VRELKHTNILLNAIAIQWLLPVDSGNNRSTLIDFEAMSVEYEVVARPKPGPDGAVKAGAVTLVKRVSPQSISLSVLQGSISLSVLQGQLYEITVRSNNTMGYTQEPKMLLARAVGPPQQPRHFTFQINPNNLTNAMGNRVGYLAWQPPSDTGLGQPCGVAAQWAYCEEGQYPLRVVRYQLRRVDTGTGAETETELPLEQPSTERSVEVNYERTFYKFRVRAANQQEGILGNFSGLGPDAESTSHENGLLSGPPLKMRLLYIPWAVNVSSSEGTGVLDERVVDPPQSRGISDYCYTNGSLAGSKCPADDSLVDADWSPPEHCARCADPELSVFVETAYTFKVRAVKDIDNDFAEFDPQDIVIENNIAEILGGIPNWQSLVSLNYSVFRCGARADDQHASDQAACQEANLTNPGANSNGYGWKEVSVSFTATKEMASQGFVANMAFTAITPTNKRSKITVSVRAIRPDPQFFEFTTVHQATMGCVFTTDVTAEDRTELRLARQTALEKDYLVGIASIGGLMRSAYRETPFAALPAGARLFPQGLTQPTNNSITYRFQWTPQRFQEGFTYVVNLQARGFLGSTPVPGVEGSPLREISLEINGACLLCLLVRTHVGGVRCGGWRRSRRDGGVGYSE